MKKVAFLLLVAMVAGLALAPQAEARKRKRTRTQTRGDYRVAYAQLPQPTITPHTLETGGVTLLYNTIDAPAYYEVSKGDKGYSNGYADESFAIDWPISLNGHEPVALQRALLDWLTSDNEKNVITSVDDLVKSRTECGFTAEGPARRVLKIPGSDESEPLMNMASVKVHRMTPKLLVYAWDYSAYFGGGTGASFSQGTIYLNYDLTAGRALTREDVFRPEAVRVLEAELRDNASEWDFLWDEFKAAPYLSDVFCIEADKVVFVYSKYLIAAGYAGEVTIEFPLSKLSPYMKINIQ